MLAIKLLLSITRISFILLELALIYRFFFGFWVAAAMRRGVDGVTLLLPIPMLLLPIVFYLLKRFCFKVK